MDALTLVSPSMAYAAQIAAYRKATQRYWITL